MPLMPLIGLILGAMLLQQPPSPPPAQGSAQLKGRLVDAVSGQPLSGAQVRLSTSTPPAPRSVTSDDTGGFVFTSLMAGQYNLTVSRLGVITSVFPPNDHRVTAVIAAGASVDLGDIRVPAGVPISGQILDEHGNALKGAAVSAWQVRYLNPGERRLNFMGKATTNESGDYRIDGLPPGTYYVSAKASDAIAPTFFPATADASSAAPITVTAAAGANASIRLLTVPLARIAGQIVNARGVPSSEFYVLLAPLRDDGAQISSPDLASEVDAAGKFAISKVPPGNYNVEVVSKGRVEAIASTGRSGVGLEASEESATKRVTVDGANIDDLFIRTQPPTMVSGKILLDGAPISGEMATRLTLSASENAGPSGISSVMNSSFATPSADGTFALLAIPGGRLIRVRGLLAGMALKRVLVRGVDVTEEGFDVASSPISDVVIELTSKPSVVSGRVVDDRGAPIGGAGVIVYSTDPSRWRLVLTRVVVASRAKADGTFSFSGLPAGSYYLVTVPELIDGAWAEPANLESLRATAQTFKLGAGEQKEIAVVVRRAPARAHLKSS
jgi:hypothetical protein